jgi:hypothetical protein
MDPADKIIFHLAGREILSRETEIIIPDVQGPVHGQVPEIPY